MSTNTTLATTKPPQQWKQNLNWVLHCVFFGLVYFAAQFVARTIAALARSINIPPLLAGVIGFLGAVVFFFSAAKYFIALRMPPSVATEPIDFAPAVQKQHEDRGSAPPIPLASGAVASSPFPASLDIARFADFDSQLKTLGFTPLLDYRRIDARAVIDTVYSRVLWNPQHACLARITQIFPIGAPASDAFCSIESVFSDGTSLSISNRKPDTMSFLLRVPRAFWIRMAGADTATLLSTLLQERERFVAKTGAQLTREITPEVLMQLSEQSYGDFRRALFRKNVVVGLVEMVRCKMKVPTQWLG